MQNNALITALDAVHTAILSGAISDLGTLAETVEKAASSLDGITLPQLQIIHNKAARNARCLQSAMKGVRAAQRRVAELRAASTGHVTYDNKGQRATLGSVTGTLRQRI
jgi:hypothetical protein